MEKPSKSRPPRETRNFASGHGRCQHDLYGRSRACPQRKIAARGIAYADGHIRLGKRTDARSRSSRIRTLADYRTQLRRWDIFKDNAYQSAANAGS